MCQMAARTAGRQPQAGSFESAGKLPTFSLHGVDLETPGALAKVVSQVE